MDWQLFLVALGKGWLSAWKHEPFWMAADLFQLFAWGWMVYYFASLRRERT